MAQTTDEKVFALTQRVEWLTKSLQQVQQQLDQTRRRIGLSGIIDDQVISINARLGNGDAA